MMKPLPFLLMATVLPCAILACSNQTIDYDYAGQAERIVSASAESTENIAPLFDEVLAFRSGLDAKTAEQFDAEFSEILASTLMTDCLLDILDGIMAAGDLSPVMMSGALAHINRFAENTPEPFKAHVSDALSAIMSVNAEDAVPADKLKAEFGIDITAVAERVNEIMHQEKSDETQYEAQYATALRPLTDYREKLTGRQRTDFDRKVLPTLAFLLKDDYFSYAITPYEEDLDPNLVAGGCLVYIKLLRNTPLGTTLTACFITPFLDYIMNLPEPHIFIPSDPDDDSLDDLLIEID